MVLPGSVVYCTTVGTLRADRALSTRHREKIRPVLKYEHPTSNTERQTKDDGRLAGITAERDRLLAPPVHKG